MTNATDNEITPEKVRYWIAATDDIEHLVYANAIARAYLAKHEESNRLISLSNAIAADQIQRLQAEVDRLTNATLAFIERDMEFERMKATIEKQRGALQEHHDWQEGCDKIAITDDSGFDVIIDCEYYDSSMRERTIEALALTAKEEL